ncbi:MAG: PAS domain S-box protein [Gemmatimonadetes bacterium]|nr:PAS domain S-box protein [Gemmatimonadota bacterium]
MACVVQRRRPMRPDESTDRQSAQDLRAEASAGAPDPDATGSAAPPPGDRGAPGRETQERQAAARRGEARARERAGGSAAPRDPYSGLARPGVAHQAFAALAENVRDYAIFLLDPDGIITFWGEGARLIKWWTKDQAEGAHLRLLYPDGGGEDGTAEAHLQCSAETGEYTGEGHRIRSDGSTFWAGLTLTALRDADGTLLGFAKVTRDLTAQRATESARRAALEAAEEASRLKSLFLATMSHEIRTPLNAIMAYTDLLAMEMAGPLTQAQHEQLGRIRSSSQHLLGIIDDVLDLSRIESGRMTTGRARLRVGTMVSEALVLVEPQAASRRVDMVNAVSGFATDHQCWGDAERVRQILVNLLSNAVKFTDPGGRITVSAGTAADAPPGSEVEGPGPWVYFRVEDTGRGIPPERMVAIFEPFVQADMALTRQHGGAGLGLAISRRLARLMGGGLTARSQVGVGSTFFLWLPAAPDQEAVPAPRMEAAARDGILHELRDAVLSDLERILHAYVARLRGDPAVPGARALSEQELEDHLASFLSDLALTVGAMDLAAGGDSPILRDATAIQRVIADRHGQQRARLGWTEDEIRREFQILREELSAAVRRRVRRPRDAEVGEAIGILEESLAAAESISLQSHRAEAETPS